MVCDLTKYLVSAAMPDKSANTVAKTIYENFITTYGLIREIRSDCGTEFKNEIIRDLCEILNIKQTFSTAYRHETVGTAERNHRSLNEYIRAYVSKIENWEAFLKSFTFSYNISVNASLGNKFDTI